MLDILLQRVKPAFSAENLGSTIWWGYGLFVFIALFFSTGFYHPDEHFQILEFLNFKQGLTPRGELPWEFQAQMRPWFQPFVSYGFVSTLSSIGVNSPFTQVFFLRLVSAVLASLALWVWSKELCRVTANEKSNHLVLGVLLLSWFIPFMAVRNSSETWSMSFMLLGTSVFIGSKEKLLKDFFLAGLFFGLAVQCRYQLGLMVVPLMIYALINRYKISALALTALGGILITVLGAGIDYWGYGELVIAPWNYLKQNLILDKASGYGVAPIWDYFRLVLLKGFPPISWCYAGIFLLSWWRYKKDIVAGMTFWFFLLHSLIGHKELRFLFPMIPFATYLLVLLLKDFELTSGRRKFFVFIAVVNFIMLPIASFKAPYRGIDLQQYWQESSRDDHLYLIGADPFMYHDKTFYFYNPKLPKRTQLTLESFSSDLPRITWLFADRGEYIDKIKSLNSCEIRWTNYPLWSLRFNIGNWVSRSKVWTLWKCKH